MMPPFIYRPNFLIEVVYSALVILSCIIIYLKSNEIYRLTSHRGIKYFSKAFFFFSVAYFFRFFFGIFFRLFVEFWEFRPSRPGFMIGMVIYIYASTLAALYSLYSVLWKRLGKKDYSLFLHIIAITVTFITANIYGPLFHILILFILFSAAAIIGVFEKKKGKEKNQHSFYFVYALMLLFWMLNTLAPELPWFFLELKLVLYISSLCLFLVILWRVLKVTGRK